MSKRAAESFVAPYKFNRMAIDPWNHSEWSSSGAASDDNAQLPAPVHPDPEPEQQDPQPMLVDGVAPMADQAAMVDQAAMADQAAAIDQYDAPVGKRWSKRWQQAQDGSFSYSWKLMSTAKTDAN
jgi:hypothetical protein